MLAQSDGDVHAVGEIGGTEFAIGPALDGRSLLLCAPSSLMLPVIRKRPGFAAGRFRRCGGGPQRSPFIATSLGGRGEAVRVQPRPLRTVRRDILASEPGHRAMLRITPARM